MSGPAPNPSLLTPLRPSAGESKALAEFRRMMKWIAVAGVLMVAGSIWYLSLFGPLNVSIVAATVGGVFVSVMLGCGLFAAAFFSDKSGHDQNVTNATSAPRREPNAVALPDGLTPYKRTAQFTETSVPVGLLRAHNTKVDTWGLIHVAAGRLRYRVTDPRRAALEVILTSKDAPGIVEPTIQHEVAPDGSVSFHVEFLRMPAEDVALCRHEELARRENSLRVTH